MAQTGAMQYGTIKEAWSNRVVMEVNVRAGGE